MYEVGMRVVRIKTGQHYVISKVEGEGAETRYYLKHMNGSVDLITRDDEMKTLFRLDAAKYIEQLNKLSEATECETVYAVYPNPSKNVYGNRKERCMKKAEKDAMKGKCMLLVRRTINTPDEQKGKTIEGYIKEIEQIATRYTMSQSDGYSQIMRICDAIREKQKYALGYISKEEIASPQFD